MTATADDALSAIVSGSWMRQSAMRLSMTSSTGATDAVAASTSSADTLALDRLAEDERHLALDAGAISPRRRSRSALHDHRREQVAVVGLVDAELPLDRLARQPDLVARDPPPRRPQGASRPLHGVGVIDREIAVLGRERLDRRGRHVRPQQATGEPFGVDGGRRAHVATVKNARAAPRRTRRSRGRCPRPSRSPAASRGRDRVAAGEELDAVPPGSKRRRRTLREPVLSRPASKTMPSSANMSAARRIPSGVSTEYLTWCSRRPHPRVRHHRDVVHLRRHRHPDADVGPVRVGRPRGGGSRARPRASPRGVDVGGGRLMWSRRRTPTPVAGSARAG